MKLLLTFDLEEYERAGEKGFDIGYKGGKIVQKLLKRTDIPATFFVTASFFLKFPDFVKELSEDHEIAFHGFNHHDDYEVMPEDEAAKTLIKGKTLVEQGLSLNVEGFRAPRMRPPSYSVLKRAEFVYSSSLHPTYVPGRYNHMRAPRSPFLTDDVVEIPVSVAPVIRLPLSWVWFRQLGVVYARIVTKTIHNYLCIYFHPWEFVPLAGYGGFTHTRNTGAPLEHALENYLKWLSPQVTPMKMGEFAKEFIRKEK